MSHGTSTGSTLLGSSPQAPRRRQFLLLSNREVAPSTHLLTFGFPSEESIDFAPGQCVTFFIPKEGRLIPRSYSIFSSAREHHHLSFLVESLVV